MHTYLTSVLPWGYAGLIERQLLLLLTSFAVIGFFIHAHRLNVHPGTTAFPKKNHDNKERGQHCK